MADTRSRVVLITSCCSRSSSIAPFHQYSDVMAGSTLTHAARRSATSTRANAAASVDSPSVVRTTTARSSGLLTVTGSDFSAVSVPLWLGYLQLLLVLETETRYSATTS